MPTNCDGANFSAARSGQLPSAPAVASRAPPHQSLERFLAVDQDLAARLGGQAQSRRMYSSTRQTLDTPASGRTNNGRAGGLPAVATGQTSWEAVSDSLLRARLDGRVPAARSVRSQRTQESRHGLKEGDGRGPASESGISLVSSTGMSSRYSSRRTTSRRAGEFPRDHEGHQGTDRAHTPPSAFRRAARLLQKSETLRPYALSITLFGIVLVKWAVGLGGYSGRLVPPMRGDLEAQRHWIALTSSWLGNWRFLQRSPSSTTSLRPGQWYFYDLAYWGLDYPPLTAYHSLFLGFCARLSRNTARYVTLRPPADSSAPTLEAWNAYMTALEVEGGLKVWMRATVVVGDLLVYLSAVVRYCTRAYGVQGSAGSRSSARVQRRVLSAVLMIGLQPALLLIDNGHFQYNSIMLGLTLWAINCFEDGRDVIGAVLFVCALCFKQMALYYAPAIFAYLLGKCVWLGRPQGVTLFVNLGFAVIATTVVVLSPFLWTPDTLLQVARRVFPFARGLFEDKVANFWCTVNVVIKLKDLFSEGALAKLALLLTSIAVAPIVVLFVLLGYWLGQQRRTSTLSTPTASQRTSGQSPTLPLLLHALFLSAMAFFLFSFQVHEKSILLPLLPLTLIACRYETGEGRREWDWVMLVNNTSAFSMWPLLRRDGLALQYFALLATWNCAVGYNPWRLQQPVIRTLSLTTYVFIACLHGLEWVARPPQHLPDLFVVLNQTAAAGVFGLAYLWSWKRLMEDSWALLGIGERGSAGDLK